MVLDDRALGIDWHLRLVVKARDALGLRRLGLSRRLGNGLSAGVGRSVVLGRILGHVLAVRDGDGLVRIFALGLGAHAQYQVAQARDRTLHVGGRLVGVQVRPVHHKGRR